MDKSKITYWSNLEIPIEDFLEEDKENMTTFTRKIFNRLKDKSPHWFKIPSLETSNDEETKQKLREEYDKNKENILDAYCCSWFAHKLGNPDLVSEFAKRILIKDEIEKIDGDDQTCMYLLFKKSEHNLIDLYYEHFLQRIQMETYLSDSTKNFNKKIDLTEDRAQKILDKYERKRKSKRQKSKVWWFKEGQDNWIIIFRRSRLKGSPIKLVDKNSFIRMADLKAFRINKNFLKSFLYSNKEPARMAKCLAFFAKELVDLDIKYLKQEMTSPTEKVNKFISSIQGKNNKAINVLEIGFRNFPWDDSPIVIIKSQDNGGINNSIEQIKDEGKHPGEQNCLYVKLNYKNKTFDVKFNRQGDNTGIALNYRGLLQNARNEILKFLGEELK